MSRPLDERHEKILLLLKRFDYLNIRHIRILLGMGESYVYRFMSGLHAYVSVFKDNRENIYYLSKAGREFIQSDKALRKITTAQHYMMRADLFILLGQPDTWRNEVRISYTYDNDNPNSRVIRVVADAHYVTSENHHIQHHIVEIDNAQKMNKNKIKIEKYRRLTEKGVFKGLPQIIWVTTTAYRKKALLELCEGLNVKVYLKGDLI